MPDHHASGIFTITSSTITAPIIHSTTKTTVDGNIVGMLPEQRRDIVDTVESKSEKFGPSAAGELVGEGDKRRELVEPGKEVVGGVESVVGVVGSAGIINSQETISSSSKDEPTPPKKIENQSDFNEIMNPETHILNPLQLILKNDEKKGRGVFTNELIKAGTVIEESPVLVITKEAWEEGKLQGTILGEYGFCWVGGGQGIGLGMGKYKFPSNNWNEEDFNLEMELKTEKSASMFNHSIHPNVNYIRQPSTSTIKFIASRTIQPGEELCICYSADESKLWFNPIPINTSINPISSSGKGPSSPDTLPENNFPNLDPEDIFDHKLIVEKLEKKKKREIRKSEMVLLSQGKNESMEKLSMIKSRSVHGSTSTTGSQSESSRSGSISPSSSGSSIYPIYPSIPDGPPPDLPTPLHSDTSKGCQISQDWADLCPDLEWKEDDWVMDKKGKMVGELRGWKEIKRIKGPSEIEEDKEFEMTMKVWIISVTDNGSTRLILDFIRDQISFDIRMKHLKRVARKLNPINGEKNTVIALCHEDEATFEDLIAGLNNYHPSLKGLDPYLHTVPSAPARTTEELKTKGMMWPTSFGPGSIKSSTSDNWSMMKKAWVQAGISRLLEIALENKLKGELPIGIYVTSPPTTLQPSSDNFIPPTPNLRSSSCDSRQSTLHPLRHSVLNVIRSIADLRLKKPFSDMELPTRNGADYLLTSMSLFVTHEPCVMCCMALLHSRVREVFYIYPREKGGGGFESAFGVHGRKDLNHRFDVWKIEVDEKWEDILRLDDGIAV